MKKLKKGILGLTTASVTTSIGANILTKAGSPAGAAGLASVASFYPSMGAMMGGGAALRMLGKLKPKKKRR